MFWGSSKVPHKVIDKAARPAQPTTCPSARNVSVTDWKRILHKMWMMNDWKDHCLARKPGDPQDFGLGVRKVVTPAPVPIQTPAAQEKVRRNCTTNTQLVKHTLNKHTSHNHQKFFKQNLWPSRAEVGCCRQPWKEYLGSPLGRAGTGYERREQVRVSAWMGADGLCVRTEGCKGGAMSRVWLCNNMNIKTSA